MAYLVPGDFCDLHVFVLKQMDHSIGTISPDYRRGTKTFLKFLESPKLSLALWCAALVDAVLRDWLVNVGQRRASQRLACSLPTVAAAFTHLWVPERC